MNHNTSDDLAVTFKGHQETIYEDSYFRAYRLTYSEQIFHGVNWVGETVIVVHHATPHHPRISEPQGPKVLGIPTYPLVVWPRTTKFGM